ncbi:MAG: hypothetical protein ACPGSD_00055 [Flavobacteriales bacterium]
MSAFDNIPIEDMKFGKPDSESGVCKVWYAPLSIVTGTPALHEMSSGTTVKELGTFDGDVTFDTGKGWSEMDIMVETGEPKSEGVGPKGQRRQKSMFDFMVEGDNASVLGAQRLIEGVPMIYLVKHKGGDLFLVGDMCNPAYATASNFTGGKGHEDTTGCTFTVEATRKLGVYTGVITEV